MKPSFKLPTLDLQQLTDEDFDHMFDSNNEETKPSLKKRKSRQNYLSIIESENQNQEDIGLHPDFNKLLSNYVNLIH